MEIADIRNAIRSERIRITDHADEEAQNKLAKKEGIMKLAKKPFDKCPVCGGELEEKEVEKLLRGGVHTAVMKVHAGVCLHCGERLYSPETVRRFEEIRRKLERKEVASFQLMGQSFQVA